MDDKIIVIGDIHSKSSLILPILEKVISVENPTKLIFLGDYVDEYDASQIDVINELKLLVDFYNKFKYKLDLIMLCGNHDFQYLNHSSCSGTNKDIIDEVETLLMQLNLKLAYKWKDYLFTHAGLESNWKNFYLKDKTIEETVIELNNMLEKRDKHFNEASPARGGTTFPSPIWSDKQDLLIDPNPINIKQIVGHSPVDTTTKYKNFILCDTFSRKRNGIPVGDGSFLILEDNNIKIKSLEEYGFDAYKQLILDWEEYYFQQAF